MPAVLLGASNTSGNAGDPDGSVVASTAFSSASGSASSSDATRDALAGEAADLLYHALVLLAERDLPPSAVIDALRARHAG